MKGFLYVLINPNMPGLVKIGRTERDPGERAKELSRVTGVPSPFVVAYECFFSDCAAAEAFCHTDLSSKGFRVSENREFFEISCSEAINSILRAKKYVDALPPSIHDSEDDDENSDSPMSADSDGETDFLNSLTITTDSDDTPPWEEFLELGNAYYSGEGECLQDFDEALVNYKKAVKLGSGEACKCIGGMFEFGDGVTQDDKLALQWYKEGVKKGYFASYSSMVRLFAFQDNFDNAAKCFSKALEVTEGVDFISAVIFISGYKERINPILSRINLAGFSLKFTRERNNFLEHIKHLEELGENSEDEKIKIDFRESVEFWRMRIQQFDNIAKRFL